MSDFDDLDDLFGPLRSPATPAELAPERRVVDLMAAAHHPSKESTMFTSRQARVATLIAAGILGFGGVAAAGSDGIDLLEFNAPIVDGIEETNETPDEELPAEEGDEEVPAEEQSEDGTSSDDLDENENSEQADEAEQADEPADVDESEQADDAAEGDEPTEPTDPDESTVFNEAYCLEGNHGKTVSAVARGELPGEVRDAAHSSCGKTDSESGDDADDVDEPEVDTDIETEVDTDMETEVDEDVVRRPSTPQPDHAGGKNNGNGNAKNGNGNNGNGNGNGKKGG
jgi:hypothetical protein